METIQIIYIIAIAVAGICTGLTLGYVYNRPKTTTTRDVETSSRPTRNITKKKKPINHKTWAANNGAHYSEEENEIILRAKSTHAIVKVARKLGRTPAAINTQRSVLRKRKPRKNGNVRPWTAEEDKFIQETYGLWTERQQSEKLGRTMAAIRTRKQIFRGTRSNQKNATT